MANDDRDAFYTMAIAAFTQANELCLMAAKGFHEAAEDAERGEMQSMHRAAAVADDQLREARELFEAIRVLRRVA